MFKANQFTNEEWPLLDPHSPKDVSIGEEQGDSPVTAVAWSPPGLARHRRPVLAVLTANHLLSLWASNSKIDDSTSWQRVLIANHVDTIAQSSPGLPRIRSMAWAPSYQEFGCNVPFSRWKWGICILGVADDDGGLHFLQVSSQFVVDSDQWNCERICGIDTTAKDQWGVYRIPQASAATASTKQRKSLFAGFMSVSCFIDSIIFSPWANSETVVTFRAREVVSHLRLYRTQMALPSSRSLSGHFQLGSAPEMILSPEDGNQRIDSSLVWTYGTVSHLLAHELVFF